MAEDIKVPDLGESVSEGTLAKWIKKQGDSVKQDEPIAELETDKVAMEINAPDDGVIAETLVEEGDTVEVGDVVARLDKGGKAAGSDDKKEKEEKPSKKGEPEDTAEEEEAEAEDEKADKGEEKKDAPMSPSAKKLAKEHGLSAADIDGTGKDGRITKADVEKAAKAGEGQKDAGKEDKKEEKAEKKEEPKREPGEREERVPMSRLRKRIAERLKEAQDTAAMLTTFNEADMSAVMRYRNEYRDTFEDKHGIRLGFMSFFVKAAVRALQDIPAVNAEIDGDDIVYKNHYDIGVAVSTPNGLVVPVVRDADRLGFAELEKTIHDLGLRGRDGKLKLEELQGGTFTISNGGVFGSLMSAPILNPPQSGILGMHKIQERPVAMDGEVVIRPMMYLALSYDHRIVDGKEAVTFLVRMKECIEDPGRLMLDL